MRKMLTAILGAALALALHAAPAAAQVLTFVSATGSDANPCTVQANPCKTLPRAIQATAAGGEIRLLSQIAGGNTLLTKSLTIDGGGHTLIGTISINSASAIVTLRNLSLTGRGTVATGINIVNAAVVHIEDCTVERYTGNGISLAASVSTELFVSNSVSRDNGVHGLEVAGPTTAKLTVDNSRFENNANSGVNVGGGQASVTGSVFSGNNGGGMLQTGGTTNITHSTAVANLVGFEVDSGEMTLDSCVARGGDFGLFVSISTVARISSSVFTNNTNGVSNNFGGNNATILTSENNVIVGNTENLDGATALTPLTPQ
jgi:hypothetical protein